MWNKSDVNTDDKEYLAMMTCRNEKQQQIFEAAFESQITVKA